PRYEARESRGPVGSTGPRFVSTEEHASTISTARADARTGPAARGGDPCSRERRDRLDPSSIGHGAPAERLVRPRLDPFHRDDASRERSARESELGRDPGGRLRAWRLPPWP